MAGELEKLLRDAGLPQEQIDSTLKAFDTTAIKAIEEGTMRKADYSRGQDQLRAKQAELQSNWEKANTEYVRMQTDWDATVAEKDAARAKLAEAEKKLNEQPKIDPEKFVSREQWQKEQQDLVNGSTAYFGDLLEIADEHRELFGKRISSAELIQKAAAAKQTPREFWESTYKVPEKRQEIAAKAEEDKLTVVRKEAYDKAVADLSKPPSARELEPSKQPFYTPQDQATSPWDSTGPSEAESTLLKELTSVGR
jgi:hypothetical protein